MKEYPEDLLNKRREKFIRQIKRKNFQIDLRSAFGCGTPGCFLLVILIVFILAVLARYIF